MKAKSDYWADEVFQPATPEIKVLIKIKDLSFNVELRLRKIKELEKPINCNEVLSNPILIYGSV